MSPIQRDEVFRHAIQIGVDFTSRIGQCCNPNLRTPKDVHGPENMHDNTRIERMCNNLHHRKTNDDSRDECYDIANFSFFPFRVGPMKYFKGEENHHHSPTK